MIHQAFGQRIIGTEQRDPGSHKQNARQVMLAALVRCCFQPLLSCWQRIEARQRLWNLPLGETYLLHQKRNAGLLGCGFDNIKNPSQNRLTFGPGSDL